jgi:uncharacterized protein YjiS (DUF1127 family)
MAGLNPRAIWKCWLNRLKVRIEQLASGDNWRRDLGRMTERDLMDIGLIRSDIHRITRGMLPPTDRPLR